MYNYILNQIQNVNRDFVTSPKITPDSLFGNPFNDNYAIAATISNEIGKKFNIVIPAENVTGIVLFYNEFVGNRIYNIAKTLANYIEATWQELYTENYDSDKKDYYDYLVSKLQITFEEAVISSSLFDITSTVINELDLTPFMEPELLTSIQSNFGDIIVSPFRTLILDNSSNDMLFMSYIMDICRKNMRFNITNI